MHSTQRRAGRPVRDAILLASGLARNYEIKVGRCARLPGVEQEPNILVGLCLADEQREAPWQSGYWFGYHLRRFRMVQAWVDHRDSVTRNVERLHQLSRENSETVITWAARCADMRNSTSAYRAYPRS